MCAAPAGNLNAIKHGLESRIVRDRRPIRHGLVLGEMPQGFEKVAEHTDRLRREIEDAVLLVRAELSLVDCATIQTACRWERVAQMASRWLQNADEMTQAERLHFAQTHAKASAERDRCLRALGIDREPVTLQGFYVGDDGSQGDDDAACAGGSKSGRTSRAEPSENSQYHVPSSQVIDVIGDNDRQ